MSDIVIWTPMNSKSGLGHFYRMFGLYEKLLQEKQRVSYFTNDDFIELNKVNILHIKTDKIEKIIKYLQEKSIKIIIIDNYEVSPNSIKKLNNFFKIVYFDAKFENPQTDAIINFNPFSLEKYNNKNPKTKYFLGLQHMIYRKELKDTKNVKVNTNEIFISIGGSDVEEITYKLLPLLPMDKHYNIVLGKGCSKEYYEQVAVKLESLGLKYDLYQQPSDYFEILARSEFAIISCSTSAYEVIYLSKAFICINVVQNQDVLEEYLKNQNIITLSKNDLEKITNIIDEKKFRMFKDKKAIIENQALLNYIKEALK